MTAVRIAGCDLGKSAAKLVIITVADDGSIAVDSAEEVVHDGRPMEVFADWYQRADIASCAALGATGLHADELIAPVLAGLPEDACIEQALGLRSELAGPVNLVSVGARGYSVLVRAADGRTVSLSNDKCSSGTGETMVKIAGRFGLSIEEADQLAAAAADAIPITARCSVFAKSEMTHFGNQGRPADALFRGYFGSVAKFVASLLARAKVDGPVMVIGGGARITALVDALGEAAGEPVLVPDDPTMFEAIGAAALAAQQHRAEGLPPLPASADDLIGSRERRFRVLEPARAYAHLTRRLQAPPVTPGAEREPAVLGLDLGSTGSKAVLTSIATGEQVLDLYDRTRGNPVEAATRLVRTLLEDHTPDVRAIGVTGSGREAVATVLRAAYPDMADRVVVINEIVAHATAAIRCDPDGGRSLSVVEIGGQDAKFIQIAGGRIVESDMNKACSAGTGSFLEEQAVFYGVNDIEEFTRRASEAERPPDLGQMCTVFVAEAAAEAHNDGFAVEDLFGGFQYSVIHNYINRVMGQRTFGERIFFQGKPAAGPSLPWTLAGVTGCEVMVPPNPGAMGAWGIGLCARNDLGTDALAAADPFELDRLLGAEVVARREIQCRDKRCQTLCRIDKTTVAIAGTKRTVVSGGACPKYEVSTAARPKLAVDAPSAFDERAETLAPFLEERPGPRTIGIPMVGALHGFIPWMVTLLHELGLGVRVLQSTPRSLAHGEELCFSFDACAPIKIAHGVAAAADLDALLLPKLLTLPDRDGDGGSTCPMEQGLPEMVAAALEARGRDLQVVAPVLDLGAGLTSPKLAAQLLPIVGNLGGSSWRLLPALRAAAIAHARYEARLAEIGQRTLRYGRTEGIPVVAVLGSLHVIHDPAINAGIPRLLRENGVLALPMDCFAIPATTPSLPRVSWADANRALRTAVACRSRGDVYPLLLSSFGCGPGSFSEQIFAALMDGYPFTALESDGHGGTAGYVTRVQSFLHTVRQHDRAPSPAPADRMRLLEPLPSPPLTAEKQAGSRLVMFSVADRLSGLVAEVYRSYGFDAVPSGPSSAEVLASGRRDCSGKECVPYQLIWGAFRQTLEASPPEGRTVLMQVSGEGRCRNCMFSIKDQLSVERMGLADKVALRHYGNDQDVGVGFTMKLWMAVTTWDLLYQLLAYYRPLEATPGQADDLYVSFVDRLQRIITHRSRLAVDEIATVLRKCRTLLRDAAVDFKRMANAAASRSDRRVVLLSGDVYIRIDEFASDDLVRRLNHRGMQVIVEPTSTVSEYMAEERLSELFGLPTKLIANQLNKRWMKRLRRQLQKEVAALHPWLPQVDAKTVIEASRELLNRYPQGEAPVTIGSVLHCWDHGMCDGVVVASPWGCAPALVSESLLRHKSEIPMLFIYSDGSPMDERRLNAFAFRLRRAPPVAAAS